MVSIVTAPTVTYQCEMRSKDKEIRIVDNPIEAPPPENIEQWHEAIVQATLITPMEFSKDIKTLCD